MATDRGSALSLRGVTQRFGGVVAVRDVDLDIPHGTRRALLGPNGAGKTTLFNIIAGDHRPTSGTVSLFDQDVTNESSRLRVRRGLARTYQRSQLFGGLTVAENLELAFTGKNGGRYLPWRLGNHAKSLRLEAVAMAQRVGLADVTASAVDALSHGQQRQLEIAMALSASPRVVILDEPAAGLSPKERGSLAELLSDLPAEITLLIIEHDMDIALSVADSVTLMRDGQVVIEGTPDEIRTSSVVRDIYLGAHHE